MPTTGGFINTVLAEYVVPVNADIGSIEVEFIDEPDALFYGAGVKGLGEMSLVGVAPAIANAVHQRSSNSSRSQSYLKRLLISTRLPSGSLK